MIKCTLCGVDRKAVDEDYNEPGDTQAIEFGLKINVSDSGYYMGFTDCNFKWRNSDGSVTSSGEDVVWDLCHDCVIKLLETFPQLDDNLLKGGHPYDYEKGPCCKWGWTVTPEERNAMK